MKKTANKNRIELYRAILSLKSMNDCAALFCDIFSPAELDKIYQRFTIAKMLTMGITYSEISDKTGASTATISRVNKSLLYGNGGYFKLFERITK